MTWLNIAKIIDATEAEGPGLRTAIWTQGCLKRCSGCCNAEFLKIKPATIQTIEEIIERIEYNRTNYNIEGITLLGGEPFIQAEGLSLVASGCKKMGLSVMVFTGYILADIVEKKFKGSTDLLKYTDVLIDGEFEINQIEPRRNWVGSKNQRFHYLSTRYNEEIETMPLKATNEWRINSNGHISGNGLPFTLKM